MEEVCVCVSGWWVQVVAAVAGRGCLGIRAQESVFAEC